MLCHLKGLRSGRAKVGKATVTHVSPGAVRAFKDTCCAALLHYGPMLVFNVDETGIGLNTPGTPVLYEAGHERVKMDADAKML